MADGVVDPHRLTQKHLSVCRALPGRRAPVLPPAPKCISLFLCHLAPTYLPPCLLQLFLRRVDVKQVAADAAMTQAYRFSEHSLECGWPCNTFILLQLPVDAKSGLLCTPEGPLTAMQAIQHFFGSSLLGVMGRASQVCLEQGEPSALSWYDASKKSRGGWRGLFLPVGGAAVRHLETLEGLKSMVKRCGVVSLLAASVLFLTSALLQLGVRFRGGLRCHLLRPPALPQGYQPHYREYRH